MSNRNNIIRGRETCISDILLQSDLNKWRISQLDQLEKLYIIFVSTRLLKIPNNYFIEYKNQTLPNNSHINLMACNAASSYHCTSTIKGLNIPKQDCILNCCSYFPRMNAPYLESP